MAFNKGDTATAAQSVEIKLDILKDGNMEAVCVNSLSEALNYNTETWTDFCSKGFSSTATTGIDLEWSAEMTLRYAETSVELAKLRHQINSLNNIPMELTNTLLNEKLTINVSLTSFDLDLVSDELQKASFNIKPFQGAPLVEPITPELGE